MSINVPYFNSDNAILNRAARIAIGDIAGNCIPYKEGLLTEEEICIMAGLDYDTPWTRDTAINTMNALCIFDKDVARNTLLSVCYCENGKNYIGGQYWDAIIWVIGAWQYLLVNDDAEFKKFAYEAIKNSLAKFEAEELDEADGLFMGAAVYGDGIAAYPDKYAKIDGHGTCILDWPASNPAESSNKGFGLPMKALSTNCIYYAAYIIAGKLAVQFGDDATSYADKAQMLKENINKNFWNEETGRYDYIFDDSIRSDYSEALGLAFAILFGVADDEKCQSIIKNTYVTDHGIACVWPSFSRYRIGNEYGRHSGTVWPHAGGYWAIANLRKGSNQGFETELFSMAYKAVRDMQFAEIYHPITGDAYGGMQETFEKGITVWKSCDKQTWSATAFWAMIFYGIIGLDFTTDSIKIKPYLPTAVDHAVLKNLKIGDLQLTIEIDRYSDAPKLAEIPKSLIGKHTFKLSV